MTMTKPATAQQASTAPPVLPIAIGAQSQRTGPGLTETLINEQRLLKSALIYGDQITFYSPQLAMLANLDATRRRSGPERVKLMRDFAPIVQTGVDQPT